MPTLRNGCVTGRLWAVCGLVILLAIFTCEAVSPLTPYRANTRQAGYSIDTVSDAKNPPPQDKVRVLVRVSRAGSKQPIKPESIKLVGADGNVVEPADRSDKKAGSEKGTGLPLVVTPQANTYGGAGVGVGLNMNKLFEDSGVYSYTKVDFRKKDFVPGKKLRITLPNSKVLTVPLTSIAE